MRQPSCRPPQRISIHALREEGDKGRRSRITGQKDFYPRPPRGGRPFPHGTKLTASQISIHALREEGDLLHGVHLLCGVYFYPRPPRGGRLINGFQMAQVQLFLSTPSARRATCPIRLLPRSEQISIHALREEGDCVHRDVSDQQPDFYPRPPRGGRLRSLSIKPWTMYFYPRPPRGGRRTSSGRRATFRYFYPRPPRGGRRGLLHELSNLVKFLSTPSARRATQVTPSFCYSYIHFYPRPPRGGRPASIFLEGDMRPISIHALREEGDRKERLDHPRRIHFYPRPPRGGRPSLLFRTAALFHFYPRPPRGGRQFRVRLPI